MKKQLTIMGMVLLAVGFITLTEAKAGYCNLNSPSDEAQLTVYGPTCGVTLEYEIGATDLISFEIKVDNNSDFSSPDGNISVIDEGSAYVTGLLPGVTYYWKISAVYSAPWPTQYTYVFSDTRTFRFIVPGLVSPADGATDVFQSMSPITLDWETVWAGGISNVGYRLWIDDNYDFSSPEVDIGANSSSYSPSLDYFTEYYWKVRCYSMSGTYPFVTTNYDWSTTWNFTTGCDFPTGAIADYSPGLAETVAQPVLISWSGYDYADQYNIQIATDINFSQNTVIDEIVDSPDYTASLDDGTVYQWRVRPGNHCGWDSFCNPIMLITAEPEFLCGDVNADEAINILDIVHLINYKYKGGLPPDPIESGDVNSHQSPDGLINILDIVYLINFKYKSGSDPVCPQ